MLRIAGLSLAAALCLRGQSYPSFEKRVQAVVQRPEYRHARFGMEFYSIEDGKILYSLNPQELFVPGSTTKILSVGTALELLGPYSQFEHGAPLALDGGSWNYRMLAARAFTIAGGTSEIQHNIIGERVLGLPKG